MHEHRCVHCTQYRIVTAAYTHLSLMHVGMNGLSLYSLGSSLEPLFGTLQVCVLEGSAMCYDALDMPPGVNRTFDCSIFSSWSYLP